MTSSARPSSDGEDIAEYTRTEPMMALMIAMGVGLVVGMLLILARK